MGLGAISNLHDGMPWGMWIGFDLLCGVALAGGGFTIAAIVHVFHLKEFKPILRATVLTAFLGYIMVILALLVDLGRPWKIWHTMIHWNPHSVMFEVGWCVMLYTTVLAVEFSPMILERFNLSKCAGCIEKATPVLVILAVLLSTMHQSSLGTLYLIAPAKMHALWYSPLLPVFFFISSISLGLAMANIEGFLSFRAFGKSLEHPLMARLGKGTAVVLLIYLVLRIEDLILRDSIGHAFAGDQASYFFAAEILLGGVVPMVMLSFHKVRITPLLLVFAQFLVVLGMVFNRMNVAVTSFQLVSGESYVPNWMEIVLSLAIVAIGFAAFAIAVRYLKVFDEGPVSHPVPSDPYVLLQRPKMHVTLSGPREVSDAQDGRG